MTNGTGCNVIFHVTHSQLCSKLFVAHRSITSAVADTGVRGHPRPNESLPKLMDPLGNIDLIVVIPESVGGNIVCWM